MSLDLKDYEEAGSIILKLRKQRKGVQLSRAATVLLLDELGRMLVPGVPSEVAAYDILQILDKRAQ